MNRTLVGAALVFRVSGPEMAAVITNEKHNRVVFQVFLGQRLQNGSHRFVDALDVAVIAWKLSLPVAGKEAHVLWCKRILEAVDVALRRDKGVCVVLEVGFKLRKDQQERLFMALLQESHREVSEIVHPVDVLVVHRLAIAVPDSAFIGMGS